MKELRQLYSIIAFICCGGLLLAQQTPAPVQSEVYSIVGATAHIGNGTVIENSLIILENGKISVCVDATKTKIAYRGTIIDAKRLQCFTPVLLRLIPL